MEGFVVCAEESWRTAVLRQGELRRCVSVVDSAVNGAGGTRLFLSETDGCR